MQERLEMIDKPIETKQAYAAVYERGLHLPVPPEATYEDFRVEAIAIRLNELQIEQEVLWKELKRLKEEGDADQP